MLKTSALYCITHSALAVIGKALEGRAIGYLLKRFQVKSYRVAYIPFLCADHIDHVLETGGDAYLKTLEDELSYIVRNSIDTYAAMTAFLALVGGLLWRILAGQLLLGPRLQCHKASGKRKRL